MSLAHQRNAYQTNFQTTPNQNLGNSLDHRQQLPKFLAPENVHQKLADLGKSSFKSRLRLIKCVSASSYSSKKGKEKPLKKTIFIKTTTTKPPIVWFPGDPDCGEGDLGGRETWISVKSNMKNS